MTWFQMFYSDAAASPLRLLRSQVVLFSSLQRATAACGSRRRPEEWISVTVVVNELLLQTVTSPMRSLK